MVCVASAAYTTVCAEHLPPTYQRAASPARRVWRPAPRSEVRQRVGAVKGSAGREVLLLLVVVLCVLEVEFLRDRSCAFRACVHAGPCVGHWLVNFICSAVLLDFFPLSSSSSERNQEAERKRFADAAASAEADRKRAEAIAQVCACGMLSCFGSCTVDTTVGRVALVVVVVG